MKDNMYRFLLEYNASLLKRIFIDRLTGNVDDFIKQLNENNKLIRKIQERGGMNV